MAGLLTNTFYLSERRLSCLVNQKCCSECKDRFRSASEIRRMVHRGVLEVRTAGGGVPYNPAAPLSDRVNVKYFHQNKILTNIGYFTVISLTVAETRVRTDIDVNDV